MAFPLFTSTARADDKAGDVLKVAADQLLTLPPLTTVLRGGKRAGAKHVPVTLLSRTTAIGTLELYCVAKEGDNRWRLEFNLRDLVKEQAPRDDEEEVQTVAEVWVESQVQAAGDAVKRCYGDAQPPLSPAELPKALEAALEATRSQWPMTLCRRLWDFLQETSEGRRRSPAHLTRWLNLVGHCLRPGFGDSLDRFRIDQLWKLLAAPPRQPGQAASRAVEGGADYWILWRRVAGGLGTSLQNALFDRLRPTLLPAKNKAAAKPHPNELAEMWRAAASLERLPTGHKEGMGHVLVKQLQKAPTPSYGFWAMTRLGARGLIYGPMNCVVHPETVQGWLGQLAGFAPASHSEQKAWLFCLAQLARRTGQRALDVDEAHQQVVLSILRREDAPAHWVKMVEEVSELEREEQSQMLGDALPIGLRLLKNEE